MTMSSNSKVRENMLPRRTKDTPGFERNPSGALDSLRVIYRMMSAVRRRHLYLAFGLMLFGALAELLTIGAVGPFLALISAPEAARQMPAFQRAAAAFGLGPDANFTAIATALLVGLAIAAACIRLLLTWVAHSFVFRLGHEIVTAIYGRMLRQPYAYFVQRNSSELIAGVEKVDSVVYGVLLPLMLTISSATIATFITVILFVIDPFIASIAAFSMATLYLLLAIVSRQRLKANSRQLTANRIGRIKQTQEALGGLREILLNRSQAVFERKFAQIDRAYTESLAINSFIGAAPRFIVEALAVILIAAVAYMISLRPGGIIAAFPVLGALALGAQRLLPLLQQAYVGWSSFMGNAGYMQDVAVLLRAPMSPAVEQKKPDKIVPFKRRIKCHSVGFRYAGGQQALDGIDLTIRQGERVGFVGRTGSGKSTLVDLLMGLLEPTSGTIEVDGKPLFGTVRANWQAQLAHVPQSIYLADTSILSNIAFGEDPATIDECRVAAAAREAQISAFIESLPEGYQTAVGEHGIRLSGGQRQRIGIARALYKKALVLVFDEATSALDQETEAAVMETMDGLGRELTVLIIAHRLTTVATCDRVVRLEGGRIVADGPPRSVTGPALVERRS